jgi:hypothetical protein
MSYFDDASLVMIPSGYKDQKVYSVKPIDGSGDLTFSRASNATRVNSSGLVEKVRENLAWPSEDFTTNWVPKNGVVTANTTANPIDGAITADTFTVNTAVIQRTGVEKNFTSSVGEVTASTYFKYTNNQWVFLAIYDTNNATYRTAAFDIQNGVAGVTSSGATSTITSAGNGFYRCSVTYPIATSTNIYHSQGVLDSNTTGVVANVTGGESFITFGAQLEQGVLTDYIATTSSAVSVGPVSGLPRLDYLNSSCPRLLLEPQRTNLAFYSEQLDNAEWSKTGGLTVSANQTTSPSGYADGDKVIVGSNQFGELRSSSSSQAAGTYSASIFVKKGDLSWCVLQMTNGTDYVRTWFNIETGVIGSNDSSVWTLNGSKIENYTNGWYRISISVTTTATTSNRLVLLAATGDGIFGAALNTYFFAWGGQVEAGAYATSYIPTLGTSVTRVADAASKTGISSLIGQTEGTFYWEGVRPEGSLDFAAFGVSDGTTNNEVYFRFTAADSVELYVRSGGVQTVGFTYTGADLNQNTKIAFAYKANDVSVYVNGIQALADSSVTVPVSLTKLNFSRGNDTLPMIASVNQALLFKTRLSNTALAELTA